MSTLRVNRFGEILVRVQTHFYIFQSCAAMGYTALA